MTPDADSQPLVLVVDDELAIREAVRDILEISDIESILASDGQEAIELFCGQSDRIGLVILDLRMPRMNGVETYHALRSISENVPVILSSGYDERVAGIDFSTDPKLSLLRKPYAIESLLDLVQRAIA
jgi:two-component system, cell cycle sensor histidine kinase and response regulator CckA